MNKSELVAAMAAKAEISKKDAEKALKAFEDAVMEELTNNGKVQLVGFGTFEVTERKPRVGRNPKTAEKAPMGRGYSPGSCGRYRQTSYENLENGVFY